MLEGSVVTAFRVIREETGRQLTTPQVIVQAIAANAFPRTRLIAAIAFLLIALLLTFHDASFL
jgi:hypothetical protein